MLILNKKYCFVIIGFLVGFLALTSTMIEAQAADLTMTQVKIGNSPTVYFLSQKNHLKKTYINAASYLSYGNQWSAIKTVSAVDLKSWPEAKLFRADGTPDIYYISGYRKVLISHPTDLFKFNLVGEPVLEVSALDLGQYQAATYSDVGLGQSGISSNSDSSDGSSSGGTANNSGQSTSNSLTVYNDLVVGSNNNSLVPGTNGNLLGIFRFQSPTVATLTSLTFNLGGVYNSSIINNITAHDAHDNAGSTAKRQNFS